VCNIDIRELNIYYRDVGAGDRPLAWRRVAHDNDTAPSVVVRSQPSSGFGTTFHNAQPWTIAEAVTKLVEQLWQLAVWFQTEMYNFTSLHPQVNCRCGTVGVKIPPNSLSLYLITEHPFTRGMKCLILFAWICRYHYYQNQPDNCFGTWPWLRSLVLAICYIVYHCYQEATLWRGVPITQSLMTVPWVITAHIACWHDTWHIGCCIKLLPEVLEVLLKRSSRIWGQLLFTIQVCMSTAKGETPVVAFGTSLSTHSINLTYRCNCRWCSWTIWLNIPYFTGLFKVFHHAWCLQVTKCVEKWATSCS